MREGPPLGAHMSIAGGIRRAVDRAREVEATALQVFVKSARQWRMAPLDAEESEAFRDAATEAGLGNHLLAHASYLINLASPSDELWQRSIEALGAEIDRCAELKIPRLVVHPGSHGGAGVESGLRRVTRALDRVCAPRGKKAAKRRSRVRVLLEITAGQGNVLGADFDELATVLDRARCAERLGICFDTCHALAAGHEFRDARSYRATFRRIERVVGVHRLEAFHLNDSKNPLGSRRDRHEHIGRGEVGLEAFRLILNDPRFRSLPMVLETPKGADLSEDRINLGVLREMIGRT